MSNEAAIAYSHRYGSVLRVIRGFGSAVLSALLVPLLVFALFAAPLSMTPAQVISDLVARRLSWATSAPHDAQFEGRRLVVLLSLHTVLGMLSAVVLTLIAMGIVVAGQMIVGAANQGAVPIFNAEPGAVTWATVAGYAPPGILLLFLAASGLAGIAWLECQAWLRLARPGVEELTREVTRLHGTLDDVIAAVDTERCRIERDIHDGVQQRVIALSILIARAERTTDDGQRRELQRRAREETTHILDDLRAVAWRTYPAMLARDGLTAALEALRDRTETPVRLHLDVPKHANHASEAAAFFVISEAVSNVIKHADARHIDISVSEHEGDFFLRVQDDGVGGADPTGRGLSGIASRATARGGNLRVESPPGGPTTIEAVIPCG